MSVARAAALALALSLVGGCRDVEVEPQLDGRAPDAAVTDGARLDGARLDAAPLDRGGLGRGLDGGGLDGGGLDGDRPDREGDATPLDRGAVGASGDAGRADAGRVDAGRVDAGLAVIPPSPAVGPPARYGYRVRARWPHDPDAFTQGLVYLDGLLYESTGLRGRSSVRIGRLGEVEPLARRDLEARYFGEGLAAVDDRLVMLTWQSGVGFVYDRATLAPRGEFRYGGEGWGLTYDGARLIMSDGTARLRFLDPVTFAEVGGVEVRDEGAPVSRLNELEFIEGEVFANVWLTDRIVRIDPASGRVRGWVDLAGLRPAGAEDVLNGIAWDAAGERLLVTGKLWPTIFDIRLVRVED